MLKVLGRHFHNFGSAELCFKLILSRIWKAFWANAGKPRLRASIAQKVALLRRTVEPILMFHIVGYAWTKTKANELNRLQLRMISRFFKLPPLPNEPKSEFFKRRQLLASRAVRNEHRWGHIWASRTVSWHAHIKRHANHFSYSLLSYRPETWLMAERSKRLWGQWTVFGGSTNTRRARGGVATRIEASCDAARWWLIEHQ